MDLSALAQLQKESKKSYNDQKAVIKKVLSGREVKCPLCKQVLTFSSEQEESTATIRCANGCTDISLSLG